MGKASEMTLARRRLWALLGMGLVPCALALPSCGTLDSTDRVHDLRLLGIRAEPPDQEVILSLPSGSRDAGPGRPDGGRERPDGGGFPRDGGFDPCALLAQFDGGLPLGFDAGCSSPDGGEPE